MLNKDGIPIGHDWELKNLVGPGKMVHYQYFKNGELWYKTDNGFLFPVPVADTGDARFELTDKAILFMRWIRKYRDEMLKQTCYVVVEDGNAPSAKG